MSGRVVLNLTRCGGYSDHRSYQPGDVVQWHGADYLCTTTCSAISPRYPSYWMKLGASSRRPLGRKGKA